MIIMNVLELVVPYIAGILELMGMFIIALAAVKSFYLFIKDGFSFKDGDIGVELAKAMSLALAFLLSAEILLTMVVKTVTNLIVLAGIAGLRVLFTFVLHWEIKESEADKKRHENKES